MTTRGTGMLDLFVRGADGGVLHRSFDGSAWSAWSALGGATVSSPAVAAAGSTRIDLWVRGTDNAVLHRVWQAASGWSGASSTWQPGPRP